MEPQVDPALMRAAREALGRAYAPYSGFAVGAALLVDSGEIFRGCNVENISFGLTICAERTAVFTALQAGKPKFMAIAIATDASRPSPPCGACRQVLAEFAPNLIIFSQGKDGEVARWNLASLLPEPFDLLEGSSNPVARLRPS